MPLTSLPCELLASREHVIVRTALSMSYKRLGIARIGQQINGQFSFTGSISVLYSAVFERGGFQMHPYGCRWLSKAYPSQPVDPGLILGPLHGSQIRFKAFPVGCNDVQRVGGTLYLPRRGNLWQSRVTLSPCSPYLPRSGIVLIATSQFQRWFPKVRNNISESLKELGSRDSHFIRHHAK
jgi:hypothetical protein